MAEKCSVYVLASGFASQREDREVAGTYRFELDDGLSDDVKALAAVLAFHDNVAIKKDVDFSLIVMDERGNELEEPVPWEIPACYQPGAPRDAAPRPVFCGKVDSDEAPTPKFPTF